jgi:hypothetical protein
MQWFSKLCCGLSLVILFNGCSMVGARIKGGKVDHLSPLGGRTTQTQSDDPKSASTINNESEKTIEFVLPAGSRLFLDSDNVVSKDLPATNNMIVVVSSNTPIKMTIKDSIKSSTGAAQKNIIGDTIAKLSSMKWVQFIGISLFIFGIASMFWPVLRVLVGSFTTSLAFTGGGLLLIILPVVVVGNEILILCVIGGAVGIYFFAHRYGGMSKEVKILREFTDINKDNLDDTTGQTREEFENGGKTLTKKNK